MKIPIKIEKLDSIDWEPLSLRFVPESPTSHAIASAVKAQMNEWFQHSQDDPAEGLRVKYWTIEAAKGGIIAAKCEFIDEPGVIRLAEHIASKYPQYHRVLLGEKISDLPSDDEIVWEEIPSTQASVDGNELRIGPFRISRQHVTIDQYLRFMEATGFMPECERTGAFKFRGAQIASGGRKAGQWPVCRVGFADAIAFADWIGGRLPEEAELYVFFQYQHERKRKITFGNGCWTSTREASGKIIVLRSPFVNQQPPPIGELRRSYPADNWDYPLISFRVLKNPK